MTTHVQFASKTGREIEGAFAEPAGSGKAGGVVVVQEWWGLSDHIRSTCDRLAQAGFFALAPDLYHGERPETKERAAQLMDALDRNEAISEIRDAADFLKGNPRASGKIGVIGFCLGGGLTFVAARHVDGLAAAVPFYGLPNMPADEFANAMRVPIQAHFAQTDNFAKASVAEEIQRKVRAAGGQMKLYVYDAGHAFMRSTDPQVYDPASAKVAWVRAIDFLETHLSPARSVH